jgi:hypothetical protein
VNRQFAQRVARGGTVHGPRPRRPPIRPATVVAALWIGLEAGAFLGAAAVVFGLLWGVLVFTGVD